MLPVVNGRRPAAASEFTLRELVELYVTRHEAIRSPRTIATLREWLKRPLDAYGETRLAELETMALELGAWADLEEQAEEGQWRVGR